MQKNQTNILIIIGIVLVFFIFFGSRMFMKIEATERGVIFRQFSTGLDKEEIFTPGFHIIAPWNDMYIFNVAEQKIDEPMDILDKNGLSVNIDVTVRFYPIYTKVGYLYQAFRLDYVNVLVVPEVRSAVRQIAGRYSAEEIYSTKRSEVELKIIEEAGKKLRDNNIDMKALLIRSINLPPDIRQAIESKLKQQQEALAYKFRLDKENSEAERKRIAAEGESRANKIINSSLTNELLQMRGIEATLKLGESPNSKVVIVGGGKSGLPIILNTDK